MNNVPAHMLNRPSRGLTVNAASGLGTPRPAHVSRRGNRFTLMDNAGNSKPVMLMNKQGPYLDFIVVDANPSPSRMFFADGYDEDNPSPPACFSDNGTGPSTQATQPQSRTCAECPNAVWGSAVSKLDGKGIPACTSTKKLAVIVIGDPDELIYEFVIPPGSWGDKANGWKRYVNTLGSQMIGNRQAELSDVVTRAYFVPGKMGVMGFEPVSMITAEQAEWVDEVWEDPKETARICGKLDVARDPAKPLATPAYPPPIAIPTVQQQPPPPQQLAQGPSTPAATTEAPKRRGRPAKAAQSAPASQTAPFIDQPAPATPTAGMQTPKTPDNALQAALAAAFNS